MPLPLISTWQHPRICIDGYILSNPTNRRLVRAPRANTGKFSWTFVAMSDCWHTSWDSSIIWQRICCSMYSWGLDRIWWCSSLQKFARIYHYPALATGRHPHVVRQINIARNVDRIMQSGTVVELVRYSSDGCSLCVTRFCPLLIMKSLAFNSKTSPQWCNEAVLNPGSTIDGSEQGGQDQLQSSNATTSLSKQECRTPWTIRSAPGGSLSGFREAVSYGWSWYTFLPIKVILLGRYSRLNTYTDLPSSICRNDLATTCSLKIFRCAWRDFCFEARATVPFKIHKTISSRRWAVSARECLRLAKTASECRCWG